MRKEYIRVNLPSNREDYNNGNGEGCWALAGPIVKAAYDNDEEGTVYTVELCNDSFNYPGLISGTEIPIRMMGECRPVAIYDWLTDRYSKCMESFDLRDLILDKVKHRELDVPTADKAIRYIKKSERLLQMLDLIVDEAISAINN